MKGASSPVDPLKLNTGCTGWKIRRDSGSQRPGAADEGGVDSMETQGSGPVWKLGSPRASSLGEKSRESNSCSHRHLPGSGLLSTDCVCGWGGAGEDGGTGVLSVSSVPGLFVLLSPQTRTPHLSWLRF